MKQIEKDTQDIIFQLKEIKDCNVNIDGRNFFDQRFKLI